MSTIQSSAEHLTLNADGSSKDIKLQSNASEKVIVKSDGKVGIGTSSPARLLSLYGDTGIALQNSTTGTGTGNGTHIWVNSEGSGELLIQNRENSDIEFLTNDTERMRIDSSGNVGIGVTPENWQSTRNTLQIGAGAVYANGTGAGSDVEITQNAYYDGSWKYINTDEASRHYQSSGTHTFDVAPSGTADSAISWTTAMNIANDGNVLIGTATSGGRLEVTDVDNASAPVVGINANSYSSGTVYHIRFRINDSTKGSVTSNGTSVAYNTTSDYRLKENVVDMENATDRVKQLKPKQFNFIADDSVTVDGFLAHEVSSVVPEAISGEKDAMMDEEYEVTPAVEEVRDEEGNITTEAVEAVMGTRSVPDYQGIDQSKLVPLLVKTIQELEARITALEA
jgi:uncharacterized protein YaiE (UPF0345 family)